MQMSNSGKNWRSLDLKTWPGFSKHLFSGVFRGRYPLIYPLQVVKLQLAFHMMKYYQNEELCKKTEVSIFRIMARILEKPVFRGWYPLNYALRGGKVNLVNLE